MKIQSTLRNALLASLCLMLFAAAVPLQAAEEPAGVVNVNTANAEELALLPRVGPAVAGRILEYREANGKFQNKEDLLLVRGIGEKTFELMAPYVAVDGKTTLKEKARGRRPAQSETQGEDG